MRITEIICNDVEIGLTSKKIDKLKEDIIGYVEHFNNPDILPSKVIEILKRLSIDLAKEENKLVKLRKENNKVVNVTSI